MSAGRQASSNYTNLQNTYDGDGLRVKRTQDGTYPALYLRSSVLGGQVVAELDFVSGVWQWWRGYVYAGSQLLAVQQGGVFFVHEDPVTKSKRVTNTSGVIQSWVELDPFGADTSRSSNSAFQPRKFTTYERDANGSDEAMFRRYNRWHSRFDQPDPYDGSYDMSDPQSLNRYSYVQNDPVNFVDPTGLCMWAPIDMGEGGVRWVPVLCNGDDGPIEQPETPTVGPGGPQIPTPTQQDNRTMCDRMADDAQRAADQARKDYPNATNAFVLQIFNKAFGNITFGSYFAERPLGALGTTTYSHRNNLGNRNYQGDSGFHSDFRDTINPGEDQVHHFGAYFSAGLAGHKFAPDIHRAGDRGDKNWGDVRLSDQARWLGDFLRRNPNQLNRVGQLIKDTICNGGAVPK